jgi:hypothetical protein
MKAFPAVMCFGFTLQDLWSVNSIPFISAGGVSVLAHLPTWRASVFLSLCNLHVSLGPVRQGRAYQKLRYRPHRAWNSHCPRYLLATLKWE